MRCFLAVFCLFALSGLPADAEPIQTHRGLGYSYSPGHS
jgi:hypothetical protein